MPVVLRLAAEPVQRGAVGWGLAGFAGLPVLAAESLAGGCADLCEAGHVVEVHLA